jgi:hypothetical protein
MVEKIKMEINFMNNKLLGALLCVACSSTGLYAGGMGDVEANKAEFVPFLLGEASYTWPQIGQFNINFTNLADTSTVNKIQGWGGRFAAGLMHAMSDRFAYSAEMGWGYYGHSSTTPIVKTTTGATVTLPNSSMSLNLDQYGFDLLGGIFYTKPKYDLFFKAGALAQNLGVHMIFNPHEMLRGSSRADMFVPGSEFVIKRSSPEIMPEIKIGGTYHLNDHWLVDVAWMHAFGGPLSLSAPSLTTSPAFVLGDVTIEAHNPSLNSVMFGLEYRFA